MTGVNNKPAEEPTLSNRGSRMLSETRKGLYTVLGALLAVAILSTTLFNKVISGRASGLSGWEPDFPRVSNRYNPLRVSLPRNAPAARLLMALTEENNLSEAWHPCTLEVSNPQNPEEFLLGMLNERGDKLSLRIAGEKITGVIFEGEYVDETQKNATAPSPGRESMKILLPREIHEALARMELVKLLSKQGYLRVRLPMRWSMEARSLAGGRTMLDLEALPASMRMSWSEMERKQARDWRDLCTRSKNE